MTNERSPILPPLPDRKNWDVVNFSDISPAQMRPFQIMPVQSIREFDVIEANICHSLKTIRDGRGPAYTLAQEGAIAKDRISNHVRPRGFAGSLVGGQAVLLPFNTEFAKARTNEQSHRGIDRVGHEKGLNVLYTGALKASRAGMLGQVCLEVAYYEHPSLRGFGSSTDNHLRRVMGYTQYANETEMDIEEMLQQNIDASRRRAEKLTAVALRHAYGGAFGMGKHR